MPGFVVLFSREIGEIAHNARLSLVRVGRKKKKRTHEHDSESKLEIIDATAAQAQEGEEEELQVLTGTGRISTSGTVLACVVQCWRMLVER